MGQYYMALIQSEKETFKIDSFFGAKLMEHSYMGNAFVDYAASFLHNNPARLAWVGDYANDYESYYGKKLGHSSENAVQLWEKAWRSSRTSENGEEIPLPKLKTLGLEDCYGISYDEYSKIQFSNEKTDFKQFKFDYGNKFLYNHDTNEYISFNDYFRNSAFIQTYNDETYTMCDNPVSLITAVGNDLGGGDFRGGEGYDKIGMWANDVLEIVDKKPKNAKKLDIVFMEDRSGKPIRECLTSELKGLASLPQNKYLKDELIQYGILDNPQIER